MANSAGVLVMSLLLVLAVAALVRERRWRMVLQELLRRVLMRRR
jgi:uncharacterized protein (TIGR03382 family)